MPHSRLNPNRLCRPTGYAHAVRAGDTYFLSGQVAIDENRNLVGPGEIAAQTRKSLDNLSVLLNELGLTWADVAKLSIFLTDMSGIDEVRRVRGELFAAEGIEPPAITTVGVTALALEGALIEIEAIAIPQAGGPV